MEEQSHDVTTEGELNKTNDQLNKSCENKTKIIPVIYQEHDESDRYFMSNPKRGKVVIINNEIFDPKLKFRVRTGTHKDADELKHTFEEMGFQVDLHNNLSISDMMAVLYKASEDYEYNVQSDCFVCAILTHGDEQEVYGTDDKMNFKKVIEPFKGVTCPGLVGKPKLFFVQACKGDCEEEIIEDQTDCVSYSSTGPTKNPTRKIPSEADFHIAYSLVPGYFSWGSSNDRGSWFIQALSETLTNHWRSMDLVSIMTRVNGKIALKTERESPNKKKQIPCVTSMLTKELWFHQQD